MKPNTVEGSMRFKGKNRTKNKTKSMISRSSEKQCIYIFEYSHQTESFSTPLVSMYYGCGAKV